MAEQVWTRIGSWDARVDNELFRIFPKNKRGEAVPVTIIRNHLYLRHPNGAQVHFKRFLHQKRWHWHRNGQPRSESQVIMDVAAMLFHGDEDVARDALVRVMLDQPLATRG